jgi:hypothetical protein
VDLVHACELAEPGAHPLGGVALELGWTVWSLLATMYQLGLVRQATPGALRLNRSAGAVVTKPRVRSE